jgi:hypothetical protein
LWSVPIWRGRSDLGVRGGKVWESRQLDYEQAIGRAPVNGTRGTERLPVLVSGEERSDPTGLLLRHIMEWNEASKRNLQKSAESNRLAPAAGTVKCIKLQQFRVPANRSRRERREEIKKRTGQTGQEKQVKKRREQVKKRTDQEEKQRKQENRSRRESGQEDREEKRKK